MSLVVTVYVPEGIVMASDSRQSLTIEGKSPKGEGFKIQTVNSDAVTKTFLLEEQQIGISNFGQDLLAGIPMAGHIKKFTESKLESADDVATVPEKLVEYFRKSFPNTGVSFHIAGYKKEDRVSTPHVYYCHVRKNIIQRRNIKPDGSLAYGAIWGGQTDILTSIVNPVKIKDEKGNEKIVRSVAPIAWGAMTLQDAIAFSIYAIRTTTDTMRFQARPKNVGGPIDVLLLTPDEVKWIQSKQLHGE